MEDVLTLAAAGGNGSSSFTQTLTAFPFQACGAANAVRWTGTYTLEASGSDLTLNYATCAPDGTGCLACGSPRTTGVQYKLAPACDVLSVLSPDSPDVRTYYANGSV
jgi:hypothetical protein